MKEETVRKYVDLVKAGMPRKQAAKEVGYTLRHMSDMVKRRGIKLPNRRGKVTPRLADRICKLYEKLGTQNAVARELGLAQPTIGKVLRERGITQLAKPGEWNKNDVSQQVLDHLMEHGGNIANSIRELGVSIERITVAAYAKKIGFNPSYWRYANQMFGHWKILPGLPKRVYVSDYRVPAICTLCNTEHSVLMANLRSHKSSCCSQCANNYKGGNGLRKVKCDQTGEIFRSIMSMVKSLGVRSRYQKIRMHLIKNNQFTHDDKTYSLI